ncbi:MAG: glycosyltransferase family 4 protein [Pleurocapsa sp.]
MNILILSTDDLKGGAARSAYRLHQGLQQINLNSKMLVQTKNSSDRNVIGSNVNSGIGSAVTGLRLTLDQLPLKFHSQKKKTAYSVQWLPDRLAGKVAQIAPDILNLHWLCNGYLQIETLAKFKQPIVWTLHDMWAFTGGCRYNQDCDRYKFACGSCPQLGSKRESDLSRWIWQRKAKAWQNLDLTIVTPSKWLAESVKASSLFQHRRVEVIPYGLDLNQYRPIDQKLARELLNLPQDKQLLLFLSLQATSDRRKGFHLLQPALAQLSQSQGQDQLELIIVGASQPDNPTELGFKAHYLGTLKDDLTLALVYSAADLFIAPSVQDNLPNTVMEAIACGTPCVAFNIGGMPDLIDHQKTGYLAQPYQTEDLAQGIMWILDNQARQQQLSDQARQKAEQEFPLDLQASRYQSLFQELLNQKEK